MIQGKLERVLAEMVGEATDIIGCAETDAGVHAFGHSELSYKENFSEVEVKKYFNRYLPEDISV